MDTTDLLSMSLDDILKAKKQQAAAASKTKPKPKAKQPAVPRKQGGGVVSKPPQRQRPPRGNDNVDRRTGRSDMVGKWQHDLHPAGSGGGGGGGAGPARRAGGRQERRQAAAPYSAARNGGAPKSSILSRLGTQRDTKKVFGTQVGFSNLNHDVDLEDIKEVAATVGQVNDVEMQYDSTGRSEGKAIVTYARYLDAQEAVASLHLRTLDGTPMQVKMLGPVGGARVPAAVSGGGGGAGRSQFVAEEPRARGRGSAGFSFSALEREGIVKASNGGARAGTGGSVMKGRGFSGHKYDTLVRDDEEEYEAAISCNQRISHFNVMKGRGFSGHKYDALVRDDEEEYEAAIQESAARAARGDPAYTRSRPGKDGGGGGGTTGGGSAGEGEGEGGGQGGAPQRRRGHRGQDGRGHGRLLQEAGVVGAT
ncbi:hypothetical protein JKP88DRAFT_261919 [Tribonema minus]|uniref:RRM domain-containing protein n=1 Tax=Tribonema minus TaxID=303371 RepID=A0A836CLS9_9STRA|nr:hypothetical protein JKP88DRAFT_261919 [Tribonema minus]